VGADDVVVVGLRARPETLRRRIRDRGETEYLRECLCEHAVRLAEVYERSGVEDCVVDSEGAPASVVARVAVAAWVAA